jgi:hypothetical protein
MRRCRGDGIASRGLGYGINTIRLVHGVCMTLAVVPDGDGQG